MPGSLQQVQSRNQQLPGATQVSNLGLFFIAFIFFLLGLINNRLQDIKSEITSLLNPRAAVADGSLIGVPGTDH